jgi:hypothetical protein
MWLNTPHGQQHRRSHQHHCNPIRPHDRLTSLSAQAIVLLRSHGTELIAADWRQVEAFHLKDPGAHADCHPLWHLELPAAAYALADTGLGPVVVWNERGRAGLGLIRAGHVSKLAAVSGQATSVPSTRSEVLLALRTPDEHPGRLLCIDVPSGAVRAEQPLANANVDLQTDPAGNWLTVTDRTVGTVCTASASLISRIELALRQPNPAPPAPNHHRNTC